MAPFFHTVKSFANVPITDQGIDTTAFLEASKGVVRLFKLLERPAFIVSDLDGNITKVRSRYLGQPTQSNTLELLTLNERTEKKDTATEGLLWLLRGLSFTQQAPHNAQRDRDLEITNAFTKGYEATLRRHHNFFARAMFSVAVNACPSRNDFYAKLVAGLDGGASIAGDHFDRELNKSLLGLNTIVVQMRNVYEERGYELDGRRRVLANARTFFFF